MKKIKRKSKKKIDYINIFYILLVITLIGLVYYGGTHDWFVFVQQNFINGTTVSGKTPVIPEKEQPLLKDSEGDKLPPITCTDSDGGQDDQHLIFGTVTVNGTSYPDYCWGDGRLAEIYCDGIEAKLVLWECADLGYCKDGACVPTLCEEMMNPSPERCLYGYTTDGGVCQYWDINGGICLSTF